MIIQKPDIGKLGAGQSVQITANTHNFNVRTIYHLQHQHNTTSSNIDITPPAATST